MNIIHRYAGAPTNCPKCRSRNLIILFDERRPNILVCKRCNTRIKDPVAINKYDAWWQEKLIKLDKEAHKWA